MQFVQKNMDRILTGRMQHNVGVKATGGVDHGRKALKAGKLGVHGTNVYVLMD